MKQPVCDNSAGIRVLIAFEVQVVRESLALALSRQPQITVVTPDLSGNGKDNSADVVLLDVNNMAADAAAERIQSFRVAFSEAKLIAIGVVDTASAILACIEAGAPAAQP